jgi:hypothetical protein
MQDRRRCLGSLLWVWGNNEPGHKNNTINKVTDSPEGFRNVWLGRHDDLYGLDGIQSNDQKSQKGLSFLGCLIFMDWACHVELYCLYYTAL